jgi:hypothetical protein
MSKLLLRVQWLRCLTATSTLLTDTDGSETKLLLNRRLVWTKGARVNSFISGIVASFLPRDFLPDCDVLRDVLADTVSNVYTLLTTAIPGLESKSAKLLYHSGRDGANAAAFHAHCDDQGPTLTLIQDTDGNVFGGYTAISWKGHFIASSQKDPTAFLIRVVSPHGGPPVLFPSTGNYNSVYHNSRSGPWFCRGICVNYGDNDFYTYVDGTEYSNPTGLRWHETMTGHWKFEPAIIQVYSL